ncbi:MAG: ParB/RepB/Spo0J family partition protein [Planctomycetes bacterium]|nr:ParB/RepB/Spo0J family partition protein [Planctomycetota bacterium]
MDERVQIRRRLGRGLNALLGDDLAATDMPVSTSSGKPTDPQGELRQMPVNAIERNPYQPRTEFESSTLRELSDSIQQHGVLQPLLVRALPNGGWQLIAGERRLIAAKQAGLATVPCRVLQLEEQQVCEVALEENLKRKDLNVLEKAQAFANYLQQFGRTIEELSKQLSLDRSTVSNLLRLLDLAEPVKDSLRADKISGGHARALLSLPADKQEILCQRIESESLSVRATEAAVRELLAESKTDLATVAFDPQHKTKPTATQHVLSLQGQLRDLLGVPVEIKLRGKESGQILITFGSNDDFERVLRVLRRAA